jgi:thioesterase domain-containing protein
MSRIAQVMRHTLPVRALFEAPTIRKMSQLLRENTDACVWPMLIKIQPSGSRPPLVCVAAPNVNALGFVFLARRLGHDQPVYGLQRQDSQNPFRFYTQADYEALAASSISALNEVWPEGPCLLCGFCEGAHIAFEMARQLSAAGREIRLLAMFDAWPLENTTSRVRHLLAVVSLRWKRRWQRGRLSNVLSSLGRLFFRERSSVRRSATESPDASGEPMSSSQRAAWKRWRERMWPGKAFVPPVFNGRITVFRIRRQPFWRVRDDSLGWRSRAAQGVEIHEVPGEHQTILSEPHVEVLARKLAECISHLSR